MFCLGAHMGTVDDGYISSTGIFPRVYKKRPQDLKRRIIHYHNGDYRSLLQVEQKYLNMIKTEELFNGTKRRYYNIKPYASGISGEFQSELKRKFWNSERGQKRKDELSIWMTNNNPSEKGQTPWNKGKTCPQISEGRQKGKQPEYNEQRLQALRENTTQNWSKGVYNNRPKLPLEHYEKLRQINTGRPQTEFQKQKAREAKLKTFKIVYDTGKEDTISTGLKKYCEENNLSLDSMNWCIRNQKPNKKNGIKSVEVIS